MKSRFIDKFVDRLEKVDPEEVQSYVLRLVQEMGFLEKVFDALREGVIVTDDQGRISYLNQAASELFGIDRNSSVGQRIDQRIRGLDWGLLMRSGRAVTRDLEVFYPEPRYLNFYVASLEGESGEAMGHVLLVRDITQTRQIELEKIESEKINALTMLAAGVAHEIGNPLNSLNIHLQLLERKMKKADPALWEELGELVEISRGEIKRLDFIVEKFLSAVRPTKPQLEPTDLNDIVRESVRFLAPELRDREIEVHLELNGDLPVIPIDRDQLKQAFYNLIRNARQAIGSAGSLTIRTDMDDDFLSISFRDSGEGIAPEKLGKVFDPYFTTKKTGSGLGLLIVRRIVREHGGEIEFGSEPGAGTTVAIYLPRVEKRMRLLPGPTEEASAPAPSGGGQEVIDVEWKEARGED